jgi:hypothetical protein
MCIKRAELLQPLKYKYLQVHHSETTILHHFTRDGNTVISSTVKAFIAKASYFIPLEVKRWKFLRI